MQQWVEASAAWEVQLHTFKISWPQNHISGNQVPCFSHAHMPSSHPPWPAPAHAPTQLIFGLPRDTLLGDPRSSWAFKDFFDGSSSLTKSSVRSLLPVCSRPLISLE